MEGVRRRVGVKREIQRRKGGRGGIRAKLEAEVEEDPKQEDNVLTPTLSVTMPFSIMHRHQVQINQTNFIECLLSGIQIA